MNPRLSNDETPGRLGGTPTQPARFFTGPSEFRAWLEANHETATELWMGLKRKHLPDAGLTWAEAVPEALCFGWIDSKAERIDEDTRRQRWTPRRPGSNWSNINIAHVERLIQEGKMAPAGLAAYQARKRERSGIYSFEQQAGTLPDAYALALAASLAATAFWEAATPSYRKLCTNWVTTAKQQATNDRRMTQLIECCAAGVLIPSQRYGEVPAWLARAAKAAAAAARHQEDGGDADV